MSLELNHQGQIFISWRIIGVRTRAKKYLFPFFYLNSGQQSSQKDFVRENESFVPLIACCMRCMLPIFPFL